MRRLFFTLFLMAGIGFAAMNVSDAQDTKAKACCNKEKTTATKSNDCPMKSATVALTSDKKAECPKAGTKDCPMASKAECCKKGGAVAEKKACCTKAAAVAEVKK